MIESCFRMMILLICIILPITFSAQIAGVTATKVSSFSARTLDKYGVEFEPNYGINSASRFWDENGNSIAIYQSADSIAFSSSLGLRFGYAFSEHFEVGAFVTDNGSNWSAKYKLTDSDKFATAVFAGMFVPFGANTVIDRSNRNPNQVRTFGLGLAATYDFSDKNSIDANVQYQDYFRNTPELNNNDIFASVDYGHYIFNNDVLLVGSFVYQSSSADFGNQTLLSFTPGIGLEMNSNFIILFNGQFSLIGTNVQNTTGFNVAWTMVF